MKTYIRIFLVVALAVGIQSQSLAQNFQGIATYKTASQVSITLDDGSPNKAMESDLQKQIAKSMQHEYELRFNVKESLWSRVESLDGPSAGGGIMMVGGFSMGSSLLYKNAQDGNYEEEADVFGKPFLVKDKLRRYNWQLTDETKQVGEYTCQKAVYTYTRKFPQFNLENEEAERDSVERTMTITAWYTPEIPVSHGPDDYWGLPGLILEVNNGRTTMICNKIILNPSDGVEITRPNKGKIVNRKEFETIRNEKMQDMMKKYSGDKKGGHTMQLRIGGND